MTFSFAEIFAHMGIPAMVVAIVLVVMGLASLTVFIERIITLGRSRSQSKAFAEKIGDHLRQDKINTIIEEADQFEKHSHLARIVKTGLSTYRHAQQTVDISGLSPAERTRRGLQRYMEEVGGDLRSGLSVLASVGSTAPFVGLLGTVLGIISAFQGIAATGSGGLSSVSAGISEALIETALGLAVAIPAVLAFNYLTTVIMRDETSLTHAAGELLDTVDGWDEARIQRRGHELVA